MKIRNGFVSNSSSSSFCIYGVCIEKSKLEKNDGDDAYEIAEDISKELGLKYYSGPESHYYYIGREWCSVGDEETGKQFKAEIERKLKPRFPDEKCSTHEEAWYNG